MQEVRVKNTCTRCGATEEKKDTIQLVNASLKKMITDTGTIFEPIKIPGWFKVDNENLLCPYCSKEMYKFLAGTALAAEWE